jgi:hypothetical protein
VIFLRRYGCDFHGRLRRVARQQPEGRSVRRARSLLVGVRVHCSLPCPAEAPGAKADKMKKGHHRFQVMALCVSLSLFSGYITR